jgi:hypothetical protein
MNIPIYVVIPEELANELKLQATSEDKSIKKWVVEAIQEKLKVSDPSRRDPIRYEVNTQRHRENQTPCSSRQAQSVSR